jgi:hypothetical protein
MIASSKCSPVSPRPSAMFRALGSCPSTNHDHGSSPVTITSFLIHDHEPRSRSFIFCCQIRAIRPPGLWTRPSRTVFSSRIIFFKTVHYWTAIPPESAYANSPKGMRIHRDGSLAQAEGWTNSLSGIGHIAKMLQIS